MAHPPEVSHSAASSPSASAGRGTCKNTVISKFEFFNIGQTLTSAVQSIVHPEDNALSVWVIVNRAGEVKGAGWPALFHKRSFCCDSSDDKDDNSNWRLRSTPTEATGRTSTQMASESKGDYQNNIANTNQKL